MGLAYMRGICHMENHPGPRLPIFLIPFSLQPLLTSHLYFLLPWACHSASLADLAALPGVLLTDCLSHWAVDTPISVGSLQSPFLLHSSASQQTSTELFLSVGFSNVGASLVAQR